METRELKETPASTFSQVFLSWLVHFFTATSVVLALIGAVAASKKDFGTVLYVLVFTIIIDALDGPLARKVQVTKHTPHFNGALLDYVVDFVTWVFLPAFALIQSDFFSESLRFTLACLIVLSSCYQFCCQDLKVHPNFFKRWPSAWSLVIICLFTWPVPEGVFLVMILLFVVLSFVPIYFAHSLRADLKFTGKEPLDRFLAKLMIYSSVLFLLAVLSSVYFYPDVAKTFFYFEFICVSFYGVLTAVHNIVFYKELYLSSRP